MADLTEATSLTTTRLSTQGHFSQGDPRASPAEGWNPIRLVERGNAVMLHLVERLPETTLDEVAIKYDGPTRSPKEMEQAIEREARGQVEDKRRSG